MKINRNKIKSPIGTKLNCKGWQQEAAYRMIQNNLNSEVAEDPENLIVYGGIGKAARNWKAYKDILRSLKDLEDDETLLIQSGKPVSVFKTHKSSPRVLISNSMLVPNWATWKNFRDLDKKGLMMYGQMTAGSWIYIGSQGILQGTYETLAELGRQHFKNSLRGTITLTAGLGGMGGAQPLAVTMNDGVCLVVEIDEDRIKKRIDTGYLDLYVKDLDKAMDIALDYQSKNKPISIGLLGNAAHIFPKLVDLNFNPDLIIFIGFNIYT